MGAMVAQNEHLIIFARLMGGNAHTKFALASQTKQDSLTGLWGCVSKNDAGTTSPFFIPTALFLH